MNLRASLTALALVIGSASAGAETVEVLMDVTSTSRSLGQLVNGEYVVTEDAGFQAQTFTYSVRFDLDSALITPAEPTSDFDKTIYGGFNLLSDSVTPYTASLLAMAPSEAPSFSAPFAGYILSVPGSSTATEPLPVSQSASFNNFSMWGGLGIGSGHTFYSRSLSVNSLGAPTSADDLKAWTPAEYLAYLQAQTGRTLVGAYQEGYDSQVTDSVPGSWFGFGTPVVVSHDSVSIQGDMVIRSVAVVPEPSTYVLMGLGLSLVAAVRRRRQTA